jgi:hypothetical protein
MQADFLADSRASQLYSEDDDEGEFGQNSDRNRLIISDSVRSDFDYSHEGILLRTPTGSFNNQHWQQGQDQGPNSSATSPTFPANFAMSDDQDHGGGRDRLVQDVRSPGSGYNPFNSSSPTLATAYPEQDQNPPLASTFGVPSPLGNGVVDQRSVDQIVARRSSDSTSYSSGGESDSLLLPDNPLQIQFSDGHLPQSHHEYELNRKHCHRSRRDAPDKVARNQLIAISVLCLVFMIGEIVGRFTAGYYNELPS